MGIENNECVIATTANTENMDSIKLWVESLIDSERSLFTFTAALMNGKETVFLAPDGSKKGWAAAKQGAALRDCFITLLNSFRYEDGSSNIEWVEVGYGEFGQKVLRGNNENRYNDEPYLST